MYVHIAGGSLAMGLKQIRANRKDRDNLKKIDFQEKRG